MPDSSPLYLARMTLDAARLMRLAHRQNMPSDETDLGYPLHALLSELFGKGTLQPFRALERSTRAVSLLGYSRSSAQELQRHAESFADPAAYAACRWETFAVKPMPSTWPEGRRLGFEVRACPVVRLANDLQTEHRGRPKTYRRGSELDAWQHRRWIASEPEEITREQAYTEWLEQRLEEGAQLNWVQLQGFQRVRLARRSRKPDGRPWKLLERPEAMLRGELTVRNAAAFSEALASGVGRHAAFGFGMVLLRPPAPSG